ncbi:hypothetical protein ECZU03_40070 [Escherichia coli]|nr:hypothetical protein ECZU03_40070 [Escherichia coli]
MAAAGCKGKTRIAGGDFGKGFGVSGAAVLCSSTVADYLLQFARHLIYSTSMPPAQAQALRASLAVIRSDEGDARREKLAALITRFRAGVQDLPFTLADSCSAIQPLIVGDNSRALQLAEKLRQQRLLGHGDSPANRTCWYSATALNTNRRA